MLISPSLLSTLPSGWLDADTVRRSASLRVEPTGEGVYLVDGGEEPHWVNTRDQSAPACDCGDHLFRDRACKHVVAALLHGRCPNTRMAAWRAMVHAGAHALPAKVDLPVMGLLQNGWFREPARVQALFARHPKERRSLVATLLFMGSTTGRRLRSHFGTLCDHITWEEASPQVGGQSGARFPADPDHIRAALGDVRPLAVVAFGRVARDGIRQAGYAGTVVEAPHPAARGGSVNDELSAAASRLRASLGITRMPREADGW